jgi:hypothetical protein
MERRTQRLAGAAALALALAGLPGSDAAGADVPVRDAATPSAHGNDHHRHPGGPADRSPYAGAFDPDATIRSLPAEAEAQIRSGQGAGYALPAELNGLPGPRHVLDLADDLSLDLAQRSAVEAIHRGMTERAVRAGRAYLAALEAFESDLRAGAITIDELDDRVAALALLEADLAAAHLAAHLETAAVLDAAQRAAYDRLRGYAPAGVRNPSGLPR